ncbi:MAG: fimbrial assembly protein [Gammaproteobacteria bacterium]|nr:MAG: fimbrial assembly protein [Gammaproteobacteria bacterium]
MLFFGSKTPPMVGVDISSTAVKVLEFSKTRDGYRVEAYGVEPLPPNAVVEKVIQESEIETVAEAVRRAVKKSGTRAKHAVLAVSGASVITKKIQMPANMKEDELETAIRAEADQYIPYPLEEVFLDFDVLGEVPNNPDSVEVLLAAARSETVSTRTAVAELAGLVPKIVDIEAYAMEHAYALITDQLPDYGVDKVTAIVDIGATMTSLNVIEDGRLIYTREQPFGGKQLTEEIMRRYGLSYEDAGRVKKEGGLPENYEPEVLQPFKQTMAQQVGRFLQFFYSSTEHEHVDYIALAGGCANIPGVAALVESNLGIPAGVANPFARTKVAGRVARQRLQADAPALMIAAGLALRGVS